MTTRNTNRRETEVCSQRLATVMQVTTEGGYDAAMEAPYIYAAVDALAVRAGKWAERRQRLLLEASPDDLALPSPEAAAAVAIAAVKEVQLHVRLLLCRQPSDPPPCAGFALLSAPRPHIVSAGQRDARLEMALNAGRWK